MSTAALDRLLAVLLLALLATGFFTWRAGSPGTTWLYAIHGVLAGVLLAATVLKLRRSVRAAVSRGRWRRLAIALPLALLTLGALLLGFGWAAGGRLVELGPWTLLGWHGILALALVPFVLVHLLPARWRLLRPRLAGLRGGSQSADSPPRQRSRPLTRRALLATGALGATGIGIWGVADLLDRLGERPRRFTGSRWLPSGGIPIPTTFFGEGTPQIDPAAWRLQVRGAIDRPLDLSLAELGALGTEDRTAVLDCTGGWAIETSWRGVPLAAVLDTVGLRPDARTIEVRSFTGWGAVLPVSEARASFLATGVAGIDLPVGNGAPCRLVVPDRRGLDWVKWVAQIEVA